MVDDDWYETTFGSSTSKAADECERGGSIEPVPSRRDIRPSLFVRIRTGSQLSRPHRSIDKTPVFPQFRQILYPSLL